MTRALGAARQGFRFRSSVELCARFLADLSERATALPASPPRKTATRRHPLHASLSTDCSDANSRLDPDLTGRRSLFHSLREVFQTTSLAKAEAATNAFNNSYDKIIIRYHQITYMRCSRPAALPPVLIRHRPIEWLDVVQVQVRHYCL